MDYTRRRMQRSAWKLWVAAGLSAGLLELPFPLAGPMPPWRNVFAWFGLAPLIWAVLSTAAEEQPRVLRRAFLLGYLSGVLWYCGNCYWVRNTMMRYGDMPTGAPTLLLLGFSLVLGLYWGLFGLAVGLVRRSTGSPRWALAGAPVLWVALELAAARITSVPWDQLGYSQVDNGLVNQLAPWTGVYGISFVLVAVNALLAYGWVSAREGKKWSPYSTMSVAAIGAFMLLINGNNVLPVQTPTTATAVLVQPNLDVGADNSWNGADWDRHIAQFAHLAGEDCKAYIAGIPQTGAPQGDIACPPTPTHPDLVVWPESPAPFFELEPRVQAALANVAHTVDAPLVVGALGMDVSADGQNWQELQLGARDRSRRRAHRPLRQDSPCAFRRIRPLQGSAFLRAQAHWPRGRIHARERSQGLPR